MKIANIYKIAGLFIIYVIFQSNATGPGFAGALQVSGAPGSSGNEGTCANSGCHTDNSYKPMLSMSFFDGGNLAAKYIPGKIYTIKVVVNPVQGIPTGYGFQAVALNGSNSQAGDWGDPGANRRVVNVNGRKYIEQSSTLTNGVLELPWIAPSAGTGDVTFYATGLASNSDGGPGGDGAAKNTLSIKESGVSGASALSQDLATMNVFPNPVRKTLNVQFFSQRAGLHVLRILDTKGATAKTEQVNLQVGVNQFALSLESLSPGIYFVQLSGEEYTQITRIVKL